jgi:SprT-like protein
MGQAPVAAGGAAGIPTPAVLQAWTDALSLRHFGQAFSGSVAWAPRLRYRAGDFAPATGRIRLSLPYFARYGAAEAQAILLHELCHWWLYRQGVSHREDSPGFQALLRRVGAPAKARPMPRARRPRPRPYVYACPGCGAQYRFTRRVDHACGRCCRAFAHGRYDPRFRLCLLQAPAAAHGAAPRRRRAAE